MRSKYETECNLCEETIRVGASGARFLGQWVHEDCKAEEVAVIAEQGRRRVLPDARGLADVAQTGVKVHRQARKGWQARNNVKVG